MKVLIVSVHFKAEFRDQVLAAAREDARGAQEDEPGCLRFDVIQDDKDPNRIYFYEVYRDDAAFELHRKQPHLAVWAGLPREAFASPTQVSRGQTISPSDETYR